jgi:hypothetical protein
VAPSGAAPSPASPSPASSSPAAPATPAPATPPERASWIPEKFWDAGKGETKGTELRAEFDRLTASEAAEISRKASVPAADKYELKLPADYQLPAGTEWSFDTADPGLLTAARQFANEAGMSQEGFQKLLGLYVASRVGEDQKFATAKQAEVAKLGVNAPTRIDAVKTWLAAMTGDKAKGMLGVIDQVPLASTIEAFEQLMRAFSSQGVSGSPGAARDASHGREPARLSDADYAKLTFGEKEQYARQFDQSRFANGRG